MAAESVPSSHARAEKAAPDALLDKKEERFQADKVSFEVKAG